MENNQCGLWKTLRQRLGKQPQTEEVRYAVEFERTLRNLEARLHESDNADDIISRTLSTACDFYNANWAGFLEIDMDLGVWAPYVWFNTNPHDRTKELVRDFEEIAIMQRWLAAMENNDALIIPDVSSIKHGAHQPTINEREMAEMLPDDEEIEPDDIATQPLFTDEYFVGKFIEETLAGDTVQKDYLIKICEGLMLCVGTYQLPSTDTNGRAPQINGTEFFFDTKLLLRFLGCASEAAVSAAAELVALIQNAGGRIYYYPQTLQEMERAFENAAKSLSYGYPPTDDEMRLYAIRIQNNPAIITAKKASLTSELANANIHLAPHETFTDNERIRFGFDQGDLQQYMRSNLLWDPQVIDNDALAIWETHMRRQGNYSEYCGTGAQLPVFVTTNSRLIGIASCPVKRRMLTS